MVAEKKLWIYEQGGKLVGELAEGELAYTIAWAIVEYPKGQYSIFKDVASTPFKAGTHDTLIQRKGDTILLRAGKLPEESEFWRIEAVKRGERPRFSVEQKQLTLEEKIDILWNER
jgi:hypothetical protein